MGQNLGLFVPRFFSTLGNLSSVGKVRILSEAIWDGGVGGGGWVIGEGEVWLPQCISPPSPGDRKAGGKYDLLLHCRCAHIHIPAWRSHK